MTRRVLYFTAPGSIEIREEPLPELGPRSLLVRTELSAISAGTELLLYRGKLAEGIVLDESLDALAQPMRYPVSFGYAAVGTVLEVGRDVDGLWIGRPVFGFQPHASHFVARADELYPVDVELGLEPVTLWPTVETAVNLALDGAPRIGERVLVVGQGVVGLVTTFVLSRFPLAALWTVEPSASRRALSMRFGAERALAPHELDELDFDAVFELSSAPSGLNLALRAAGDEGRVIVGSWYGDEPVPTEVGTHFHRGRLQVRSSQVSRLAPELQARWTKRRRLEVAHDVLRELPADELISHRFAFVEAPDAYRLLDKEPDACAQVVLTYT